MKDAFLAVCNMYPNDHGDPLWWVKDFHLIDELQQVVLGGVHAHCPHGPAQLLGADVSSSVNVKLIERLQSRIYN